MSSIGDDSLCGNLLMTTSASDLTGFSPPPSPSGVASPSAPGVDEPVSRKSSSKSHVAINIDELEQELLLQNTDARLVEDEDLDSLQNADARLVVVEDKDLDSLQDTVVGIVQDKDLDTLRAFNGGNEGIAKVFGSDLVNGINGRGLAQEKLPNITENPAKGFFYFFLKSCNSYTIFLLLISSGFCFSIDFIEHGLETGWHDGIAVLLAVFMLVMFPSVANFRRARLLEEELVKKMKKLKVVRGGMEQIVTTSNIVKGDLVYLNEDDQVPADGLLVGGDGLELDDELNSNVHCDHNPFLFSGSKVVHGHGKMLVTSVCPAETVQSKMLGLVICDPKERTLLEARIEKPIAYTDNVALGISVIISLVLLLRLLFGKHDDNDGFPELKGKVSVEKLMKLLETLLLKPPGKIGILTTSLAALVIGLQHGMPLVVTFSISWWNERMVSDDAKLPNSSACVTLGLVNCFCFDATMCKDMEVSAFWIGEKDVKAGDDDSKISEEVLETLTQEISLSALVPKIPITPMDNILISCAKSRWGQSMEFIEQRFDVLDHRKICSNKVGVGSGVLMRKNRDDEKTLQWHCKGEASAILGMCSHYSDRGGETYAMDLKISKFEQLIKDMKEKGLIPIAYGYKHIDNEEFRKDGLNLLAIVGFKLPCEKDFKSTIVALENAGGRIILVSDELLMVRALAHELGLLGPGSNSMMLEGREFRKLSPDERIKKLDENKVMGNFLPKDKSLLVKCLKQGGHVVAFFGGLTASDTLTLKEADVGITEENRSTEMAREISDIVISDKGYSSLTRISNTGRFVYHNIQKFIQLQLIASISGLLITFISTMVSGKSPITALQLVWLNLIVCILGILMLIFRPQPQELTTNQASRTESLITKIMWKNIITQVIYQAVVLLIFQFKGDALPGVSGKVINSMTFNSFILCQINNQLIAMDLKKKEPFEAILYKCGFMVAVGAIADVHFLIVDFVACLADCVKLNWIQWSICLIIASLSWGFHWTISFISEFFIK